MTLAPEDKIDALAFVAGDFNRDLDNACFGACSVGCRCHRRTTHNESKVPSLARDGFTCLGLDDARRRVDFLVREEEEAIQQMVLMCPPQWC